MRFISTLLVLIPALFLSSFLSADYFQKDELCYYLGINAGAGIYDRDVEKACFKIRNKLLPFGSGKAGYKLPCNFRIEGELAHRYYRKEKDSELTLSITRGKKVKVNPDDPNSETKLVYEDELVTKEVIKTFNDIALMANLYYDFNLRLFNGCWYPYVGVGFGSYITLGKVTKDFYTVKCPQIYIKGSKKNWKDTWNFRYQVMAGVSTRVCDNLHATIEWRTYNPRSAQMITFGLMHSL